MCQTSVLKSKILLYIKRLGCIVLKGFIPRERLDFWRDAPEFKTCPYVQSMGWQPGIRESFSSSYTFSDMESVSMNICHHEVLM